MKDTAHFSQPSFSESAPAPMSGGADPVTGPSTAYGYNVNYNPNNSIQSATDTMNGNWAYTYDDFNRLKTANQTNSNNAVILAMNWGYDRFGNRMNQSATVGNPPQPGCAFDANNHFVAGCGITYDAAGDVIFDGSHTYTYDGENRILSVDNGAARYTYDAEGRRVRKQSGAGTVDYILDLAGRTISEVNAIGQFNRGEVYVGGRHLATYNNGTTYFIHADWLGTERARSDANAVMVETCANLPFGDLQQCTGSDPSPNHFTGKQRDTETNLDDFGARYFSSQYGRWMSPDWSATPVPIPYANMGNPQSLNLYAYVNNDPITGEDADGHERFEQESQGDPQQHFYYTGVSSKTIDDDEGPDFSQASAPDSFWEAQKQNQQKPPDDPHNLQLVPTADDGKDHQSYRTIVYEVKTINGKKLEGTWYVTEHQTNKSVVEQDGVPGVSGGNERNKFTDLIGCIACRNVSSKQTFTISTTPGVNAKSSFPIFVHTKNGDYSTLGIHIDSGGPRINGGLNWLVDSTNH